MESPPSVSVVMAASSATHSIPHALEAIAAQDYDGDIEVVVAAADPATADAAARDGVIVLDNPSGNTPAGLNLAARASTGEVLVRVDAHAVIPPDYISRLVSAIETTGAESVGGRQVPVGRGFMQKAIATAMSSRFGAGDARYRVGGEPGQTDTVYLGAFPRTVFDAVGGYDERFVRNQDYDLNQRIRDAGGTVWLDPSIEVEYRPRSSLGALASQYFQYGQWKRFFARAHSWSLRPRQLAPPLLVLVLFAALVGALWWRWLLWIPDLYLVSLVIIGLGYIPRVGASALGVPVALAVMHITWGVGFLVGQRRDS